MWFPRWSEDSLHKGPVGLKPISSLDVIMTLKNAHIVSLLVVFFQLGQPIRLLLNYVGEDFEDKYLVTGEGKSFEHIEAEAKLQTFHIRCFQIRFHVWKRLNFD